MLDGLREDWEPIRWTRGPRAIAGPWFWLMSLSLLALLLIALVTFSTMARAQSPPAGTSVLNQAVAARSLTKSDSSLVTVTRGLYIGDAAACNVALRFNSDTAAVTFANVQPGAVLPFAVIQLMSTNTTCAAVVALY